MARLESIKRAGFFPTPPRCTRLIAGTIAVRGPGALLDPCCGEGVAAAELARIWDLQSYGVELHEGRADAARLRLTHVWQGSYHQLKAKEQFGVLFLNPPYDEGRTEDDRAMRQESLFLADCLRYLAPEGLLILIVRARLLKDDALDNTLRMNCYKIQVYRFPEPDCEAFDQIVLIARKRTKDSGLWYSGHVPVAEDSSDYPVLGAERYCNGETVELPIVGLKPQCQFSIENPYALAPSWQDSEACYGSSQWQILTGLRDLATFGQPLCTPRVGHQAMLLAAGALNGTEISGGRLIKGSSEKAIKRTVDVEQEKQIDRERIVSSLSILDLATGNLETWKTQEDFPRTEQWFRAHGAELARAIARDHAALFDTDSVALTDFSGVQAPGILPDQTEPIILEKQKEAAAAIAFRWRDHKSVVLSGECGTGKTNMALIATHLADLPKVIVVCPGHLVPKWLREARTVMKSPHCAMEARRLPDVDRFFADPNLRFLIIGKERAKLGACWRPAAIAKQRNMTREDRYGDSHTEKLTGYYCPRCGMLLQDADGNLVDAGFLEKKKQACAKCHEPLWQATAITDKGTMRWPLAKYINQRYSKRFALIADEAHFFAGATSDQSRAIQHLATAATRLLAMTGTLYGGRASSIFHLLYKTDIGFRQLYGYDECPLFVAHHGLLETVSDISERTSRYGYKRGGAGGRTHEVPGVHPAMITLLLPYTVFVKLADLGYELPPFTERVELVDPAPEVKAAVNAMQNEARSVLRKHPKALGQYLMACLGYPDRPDQAEAITDNSCSWRPEVIATAPALTDAPCPKDDRLVSICREERAQGRNVLVYFTQTHRRSAIERCQQRLEAEGLKVAVLGSNVAPAKREAWLQKMGDKVDVLLTNGRLVETGLDLIAFPTIIQYGVEYSCNSLRQSTRRSWRLGQTEPVRVIYLGYRDTMQERALTLISQKMRAAELVDGDEAGGLAQFDESGADLFLELARSVIGGNTTNTDEWASAAA